MNHIIAATRCIKCGVDLRGASVNEPCPQCGHPCSDSVYGDYLIYSDSAEIERLDEATRLVIYGTAVTGVIIVAAIVAAALMSPSFPDAVRQAYRTLFAGVLIFTVVATTGIVLLTRRCSVAYYEAKYFQVRVMVRAGLITIAVLAAIGVAAAYVPEYVRDVLLVVWATVPAVIFMGGLARLMGRMPNIKLANLARGIRAVVWVLGCLTLICRCFSPHCVGKADWEPLIIAVQLILTLGWIGFGFATFRLLLAIHRNFQAIRRGELRETPPDPR